MPEEQLDNFDEETTAEIDHSEIDINLSKRLATYHHNYAMIHRAAANAQRAKDASGAPLTPSALRDLEAWANAPQMPRKLHELAENLHHLCSWLHKNGYRSDAHSLGHAAELLTDRLEMPGGVQWRQ